MRSQILVQLVPFIDEFLKSLNVETQDRVLKGLLAANADRQNEVAALVDEMGDWV